jgi:hypothetical protein
MSFSTLVEGEQWLAQRSKNPLDLSMGSVKNLRNVYDNDKIKSFVDSHWELRERDDIALMLGLVPTWFGNVSAVETIKGLLNPAFSHNFRVLLIPGVVHYKDESAYVELYEKLLEYAWIKLYGLKHYVESLEDHLLLANVKTIIRNEYGTEFAQREPVTLDQLLEFNYLSKILSQIH